MWRWAVAVGGAVGLAVACTADADSYIYTARKYDPAEGCLDPYTSVDIIQGSGAAATCNATCFQFSGSVYTSTVCPPLPDDAVELDASAPECVAANGLFDASCGDVVDGVEASGDASMRATDGLDAGDSGG